MSRRSWQSAEQLVKAIGDVIDKATVQDWLQEPNDDFDGLKPMEVIERGEIDRLWNMVFELRSGMPG
jgi:hypothetical protein